MKTFLVPPPIKMIHPVTKVAVGEKTFREYAFECWMNDARLASSRAALYRLVKICSAFDGATEPGKPVRLEDADYEAVVPVVKDHPTPYSPMVAMQLLAFNEAFESATSEENP